MRSTTCLEPRLRICRQRNGRTKRRRSFTPQSSTLNQKYADTDQYVTQILTFYTLQFPLDLSKARIVARIMAGDPSRGAMSVETEEEVKKGSHIVVRLLRINRLDREHQLTVPWRAVPAPAGFGVDYEPASGRRREPACFPGRCPFRLGASFLRHRLPRNRRSQHIAAVPRSE